MIDTTQTLITPSLEVAAKPETPFRRFISDYCESKVAMTASIVLGAIIVIAIFAPLISPQVSRP